MAGRCSGINTTQTCRASAAPTSAPRGSGNNIIDVAVNLGTVGQGLNLGIINGTVTIPGLGTITNLAFLARALETEVDANILSTPTLLTLDNEEARIIVGQNVPFVTGQYATTGGDDDGARRSRRSSARTSACMLRVKPQITEGGTRAPRRSTRRSRASKSSRRRPGIITDKRALESTVIVDDGQIVVLGGLIQDSFTDGTDKVPAARRPARSSARSSATTRASGRRPT